MGRQFCRVCNGSGWGRFNWRRLRFDICEHCGGTELEPPPPKPDWRSPAPPPKRFIIPPTALPR